MYYIVCGEQIVESQMSEPSQDELQCLADDEKLDVYVIRGEHYGMSAEPNIVIVETKGDMTVVKIIPQPESISPGMWLYNEKAYTDDALKSYLFHDVYGQYAENSDVFEYCTPELINNVWYWVKSETPAHF